MTIDDQKEHFSYAYVRAVAAVAKIGVAEPRPDDDSVDLILSRRDTGSIIRSPKLDLQVKCVDTDASTATKTATSLRYSLKLKNYDDLRPSNLLVPRILVVVMVPPNLTEWIHQSEEEMILRHCGYWRSLREMPATPNTSGVTVELPLANIFSVAALDEMMQRIGAGNYP